MWNSGLTSLPIASITARRHRYSTALLRYVIPGPNRRVETMLPIQIHLTLPPWLEEVADEKRRYHSDEERVALAIELSRRNIAQGTGGPFGAAVLDEEGRPD